MATRGTRGVRRLTLLAASLAIGMMSTAPLARAQNATWLVSPGSGDFNTAANWNPAAVPTGAATFGFSNATALSFSADTVIGGFTLNSGASAYNFTVGAGMTVSFTGAGLSINGGSATFTNAYIINFENAATAGSSTINNNNTLAFYNSATAGSSTIVNNDFLQFFDGTSAGSSTLTNNNNASFFSTSTAGSANIANNNTVAFYNTATAGGSTLVNNDYLQFFDSSSAGSSTLTNNHNTSFFATSTAGTANITNNSVLAFYQTSTAGSATIVNASNLSFNDSASAGNATITNTSSGLTQFFNNSTGGNARLINQGGAFDFSGSSGPNGDGKISAGSIEGAGTFNLGANTLTVGSNNLSTTVSGVIQDGGAGGSLVKIGTGTLTLSGTATYTGTTTINGGRLLGGATNAFSAASATTINGGGTLDLGGLTQTINTVSLAGGTLQNGSLAGGVSSSGGTIDGLGGTTRLFTASGTTLVIGSNGYSGVTVVSGGSTLEVDGSITATSMTNVSGTLSGTGEVRRVGILTGATLAPGDAANPTGTLSITTSLAFQSGAFYLVQVGAGASNTNVVGTASVANATVQVAASGGVQGNRSYDILHSTVGISGTRFAGVQSLSPGFTETLSYTNTDVFLNLTANLGGGVTGGGLAGSQQNIATTINNFFNNGGTLPAGFVSLFNLSGAALGNALTQISGGTATGSQQTTFNAMGQFMGVMTDPFMGRGGGINGSNSAIGYAATSNPTDAFAMFTKAPPIAPTYEPRWSVWAAGFGGSQSTSGNIVAGSNNTNSTIAGTAVGADYLISPNTIAGFALAGGGTNFSVANGGSGRSDLFQAGAYARHNQGPSYISAALAYGWQDITTNRTVAVAGLDQLRAEFNANAWSGRVEGGYRFVPASAFGTGITPYAAAQFVTFDLPAYAEQAIVGTNNFALGYNAKTVTDTRTELGVRTDQPFAMTDGILIFRIRLAWAHDYNPDRSIAATFQALPGASFVVNGAAQASDSALTTASLEMKWKNGWSAAATFEGEFSNVTASYAGKGVMRYQW